MIVEMALRLAGALLLISAVAGAVFANGPEVGRVGNTVFPIASTDVRLIDLRVEADLKPDTFSTRLETDGCRVRCRYVLRNLTAEALTCEMGFVTWPDVGNFTAEQDGAPLPVAHLAATKVEWLRRLGIVIDSVLVYPLHIEPRGEIELVCTYDVGWTGGSTERSLAHHFQYIARPAALWAGTVEQAVFVFHLASWAPVFRGHAGTLPPPTGRKIEPEGYTWEGDALVWRYEDWEPDVDFYLSAYFDFTEERTARPGASSGAGAGPPSTDAW